MSDRRNALLGQLRALLGDLAGQVIEPDAVGQSWFDLGFDSLFLTQAATAVKSRFGVKVTFRQLLGDLGSVAQLADYLEPQLPEEAVSVAAAEPVVGGVVGGNGSAVGSVDVLSAGLLDAGMGELGLTGTVLERVMREQSKVMQMQLALLRQSTPRAEQLAPAGVVPSPALSAPVKTVEATAASAEASAASVQHGPFRAIQKGSKGGLTSGQQAYLDGFVQRYVAKTPKSKAYTQEHRGHLADPRAVAGFNQNWKEMVYPIVSARSKGARIWDVDGNEWVDVTMGFGVALLGHSPEFITEAVKEQLELGVEIGPQSPLAGEVAELICGFTGMDRVTFCNTGSEAVMAALRICRTVTGRNRVALFAGAYHGTFDEVLVRGARPGGGYKTLPLAPGVAPNLISAVTVLEYGTEESLEWIRQNVDDLAAVLVETVQSRHPDLQPKAFLEEVRAITAKAETPLIFDEVITGFRCHPGGAQGYFGIEADLATYGKIIGGGMPFGFIAGKAWLMDAFDGGHWQYGDDSFPPTGVTFFAGTFVRHPLAMAAARAMLLHLKREGEALQAGLARRTDRMLGELNAYFERHEVPLRLEHFTSVWYPHFGAEVKYGSLLYYHLREKGLHVWEGRPCFLSTAHTAEDEAFIELAFKQSVAEMQAAGFLGGSSDSEYRRPGLDSSECVERFPLTPAQAEVWLASQMSREASCAFNESCSIYLEGELDLQAMRGAVSSLMLRHEALRTVFSPRGDWQQVLPPDEELLEVEDLSEMAVEAQDARVESVRGGEGSRVFDLENGPVCFWRLLRLSHSKHVLVFTVHHIACDGWSYDVVVTELSQVYSALSRGKVPELGDAVTFRDYADWESGQRDSVEGKSNEAWWLSQYAELPGALELPTDRPYPAQRSYQGGRVSKSLGSGLSQRVRGAAAAKRVTLYSFLLAGFGALLNRLSGTTDLVVGIPVAGQNWMGSDFLVGHCANLLPLRLRVQSEDSFSSLMAQSKQAVLDASEHQGVTFGTLVEKLRPSREQGHIPLAGVMFNVDPPLSQLRFDGLTHRIELNPRQCFQFDLGFNVVDEGGVFCVECDFNADLFDEGSIRRWLERYLALLESAVNNTDTPVRELNILGEAELGLLQQISSGSIVPVDAAATVSGLIEAQARKAPDRIAVRFGSRSLTYKALEERSGQLARKLMLRGVRSGELVAVCLERSEQMVAALLGILRTGAAYVPIDPAFPANRIGMMLEDARPVALLCERHLENLLPKSDSPLVFLEDLYAPLPETEKLDPLPQVSADSLAYVIYTSGSTGRPKGVEISHYSVVNFLQSMANEPGLGEEDVVLALTTVSFDIAGLELFLPLTVGARVEVAARDVAMDPKVLAGLVRDAGVTLMQATPSTYRMLLDSGWTGSRNLRLLCGGEAMPADLAGRLLLCGRELWNVYGPTETTIWSAIKRVESAGAITIGHPIDNTQLFVTDEGCRILPVGVVGELLIGGYGLAQGYRGRKELTAERFVEMDWGGERRRVYRTGDLAKWLPNGELQCLGRVDHQVKVRGYRIELGEIETALVEDAGVKEAVVVVQDMGVGDRRLVAYVVRGAGNGNLSDESHVKEVLRQRLPEYMVPSHFRVLEALPRTPNGKTDRKALPPVEVLPCRDEHKKRETEGHVERRLASIWAEVLRLPSVGVEDDFFDLGGHSVLAVKLFNRIEEEFGVRLPLATLFRAPTVEQLARELPETNDEERAWSCLVTIQQGSEGTPLFFVHGAGGNVLLYRELARQLGRDRMIYGLQSQGLDGVSQPLESVEDMAQLYLKEIRKVQPRGPYLLGGYCMGGTVAYEIAQCLRRTGEVVERLFLMDTYNFTEATQTGRVSYLLQRMGFHLRNLAGLPMGQLKLYLKEKLRIALDGEWRNLLGGIDAYRAAGGQLQMKNELAAEAYSPQLYRGPVTVFKPRVNYACYSDPSLGWSKLIPEELQVIELPVNPHAMLVPPCVATLAEEIRAQLSASAGSSSNGPVLSRADSLALVH